MLPDTHPFDQPFPSMNPRLLLCILACLPTASIAQGNVVTYRNFQHPPPGQWTQTLTGVMNGQSSPPQKQTVCTTGTPDGKVIAAANQMAAASGCQTRVLTDTARLAESEQTCQLGSRTQTIRSTMRLVDDRTITVDTVMKVPGSSETTTHTSAVYEGACNARSTAASQPSAADCADLKAGMADSTQAGDVCAQMPADMQAQCRVRVTAGRQLAEAALARCR